MSGGKSPSSLASFSHNWVGGDPRALSSAAGRCYGISPQVTGVNTALNQQADKITSAGGWTGDAAASFRSAWGKDSQTGQQLAGVWNRIGDVIDKLAVQLAKLENALESAAAQAKSQGVAIDDATGNVQAATGGKVSPKTAKASADYVQLRNQTMALAKAARAGAAGELQQLTDAMLPQKKGGPPRAIGEGNLAVGLLRALWAVPTAARKGLEGKVAGLEENVAKTRSAIWQEQNAARDALGRFGKASDATKGAFADARTKLAGVQGDISRLNGMENVSTKLAAGDAEGLAGLNGLGGAAVRGIPFAGMLLGGGMTIYNDRFVKGESWLHAGGDAVGSSGAAFGAGMVGGAGGAAAAGALGGGAIVSGGAAVIGGTAAAVGVGDFVHNAIQENWGQDIHQHGVIGGIGHGIADTGVNTGHDLKNMWDDTLGKII